MAVPETTPSWPRDETARANRQFEMPRPMPPWMIRGTFIMMRSWGRLSVAGLVRWRGVRDGSGLGDGLADHAGTRFAGDKEDRLFRRGADVVTDTAAGAEVGLDARLAVFDDDGAGLGAALDADGAKAPL